MTLVLLGGLAGLGAAAWFLPLGAVTALPVHYLLWFYEVCCTVCMRLPGHTWAAGHPELWQVLLFFGILLVLVVWNGKIPKLLFWQGMLCALLTFTLKLPEGLQITMVDVGQVELAPATVKMATIVIATVPILIVYPFLQKHFVKGVMVGAIKG